MRPRLCSQLCRFRRCMYCCNRPVCCHPCCFPCPPPPTQPVPPPAPPAHRVAFIKINIQNGLPLAGAAFELLFDGEIVGTATSGADGLVDLGLFVPGVYTLIETAPPPGFDALPPAVVIVSEDGGITINGEPSYSPVANTPTTPMTATIVINDVNIETGDLLSQYTLVVSAGAYGPFMPSEFPGFAFVGLAPNSAPISGEISAGETLTIIFLYQQLTVNVSGRNIR